MIKKLSISPATCFFNRDGLVIVTTCFPCESIQRAYQGEQTVESFKKYLEDIQNSFLKVLNPIERENQYQIPMIVHVSSYNYIQSLLNYISINGKNIALEKFVYKGDSTSLNQSAVFYLSIYLNSKPIPQE